MVLVFGASYNICLGVFRGLLKISIISYSSCPFFKMCPLCKFLTNHTQSCGSILKIFVFLFKEELYDKVVFIYLCFVDFWFSHRSLMIIPNRHIHQSTKILIVQTNKQIIPSLIIIFTSHFYIMFLLGFFFSKRVEGGL